MEDKNLTFEEIATEFPKALKQIGHATYQTGVFLYKAAREIASFHLTAPRTLRKIIESKIYPKEDVFCGAPWFYGIIGGKEIYELFQNYPDQADTVLGVALLTNAVSGVYELARHNARKSKEGLTDIRIPDARSDTLEKQVSS